MTRTIFTTRRIIALIVMAIAAAASMWLIDGRVMRTMARYTDQPRQVQPVAPSDASR